MSHISKIDTKIKDLSHLKKALEVLGIAYNEAKEGKTLSLIGYEKHEVIEDCILEIKTNSKYSVGIRKRWSLKWLRTGGRNFHRREAGRFYE